MDEEESDLSPFDADDAAEDNAPESADDSENDEPAEPIAIVGRAADPFLKEDWEGDFEDEELDYRLPQLRYNLYRKINLLQLQNLYLFSCRRLDLISGKSRSRVRRRGGLGPGNRQVRAAAQSRSASTLNLAETRPRSVRPSPRPALQVRSCCWFLPSSRPRQRGLGRR
jgi:hypothetical protein